MSAGPEPANRLQLAARRSHPLAWVPTSGDWDNYGPDYPVGTTEGFAFVEHFAPMGKAMVHAFWQASGYDTWPSHGDFLAGALLALFSFTATCGYDPYSLFDRVYWDVEDELPIHRGDADVQAAAE